MRQNPKDKLSGKASESIAPDGKARIEKWMVREAFKDYLPADIVWRP